MMVPKRIHCYLLVYTFKSLLVVDVYRDNDFINAMLEKLNQFYNKYLKPGILNKYLYKNYDTVFMANESQIENQKESIVHTLTNDDFQQVKFKSISDEIGNDILILTQEVEKQDFEHDSLKNNVLQPFVDLTNVEVEQAVDIKLNVMHDTSVSIRNYKLILIQEVEKQQCEHESMKNNVQLLVDLTNVKVEQAVDSRLNLMHGTTARPSNMQLKQADFSAISVEKVCHFLEINFRMMELVE